MNKFINLFRVLYCFPMALTIFLMTGTFAYAKHHNIDVDGLNLNGWLMFAASFLFIVIDVVFEMFGKEPERGGISDEGS